MHVEYENVNKNFRKVSFLNGRPKTGNRVVLDPRDFNEMQDIWLEQLDNFVFVVRGAETGIVDGCEVLMQMNDENKIEATVSAGHVFVNSTLVRIVKSYGVVIPEVTWVGYKRHYFILKPSVQSFMPTAIGEPGFSEMAGRVTSNRVEVVFDLEIVDELPEDWYVLLAELDIPEFVNSLNDVRLIFDSRNMIMTMPEIQEAALYAKTVAEEHLEFYFEKQELIGDVNSSNNVFTTKYAVIKESEFEIYANDVLVPSNQYNFITTSDWETSKEKPKTTITFLQPIAAGTVLTASYYPEHHIQYLSKFRFYDHIDAASEDHDNRYYTEAEDDAWRDAHNVDVAAHPTHVLWTAFNDWVDAHTSSNTHDHDSVYTRIGHKHTIDDTVKLRDRLVQLSEQIGYGRDDYYIVTQEITSDIDGVNKIFPVSNSLIDNGLGYVKQIRADITNDAVRNPTVITVIPATEDFASPSVGAFSEPKLISQRNLNRQPEVVAQNDDEVFAVWVGEELPNQARIYFASYKQGDGFFAPATTTGLVCNPDSRVSATVVSSLNPQINQRVVVVWDYNDQLYYAHIDKGQTEWSAAIPLPNSAGASDACVCWVDDGFTSAGTLHVLYVKDDAVTGHKVIYKKQYEIDLLEVGNEVALTIGDIDRVYPYMTQEDSLNKRIWIGWIERTDNIPLTQDYDNSCRLKYQIVDRYSPTVYQAESDLGSITNLNIASDFSFSSNGGQMWVQFSVFEGGQFAVYYQEFEYDGNSIGEPVFLEYGHSAGAVVTSDTVVWSVYQYLNSIYFRARENGAGEVKWNLATKELEFERAPVAIPFFIDIAVPLRSLNKRISELESRNADSEALIFQHIRSILEAMHLDIPQESVNFMREKVMVESETDLDTRRLVLGKEKVIFDKFYEVDKLSPVVLKGGNPTLFENSGLEHERMGKLTNPTNQSIKIYSKVFNTGGFMSDGNITVDMHGDLECLSIKITSQMTVSPHVDVTDWYEIADAELGKPLNYLGVASFTGNNDFGVEIEILPGGWIYDWALFL